MNSIFLVLHLAGGSLAIITGFSSLIPRKGTRSHMLLGKLFFYSMLVMAGAATYLAIFSSSEPINACIGFFTLYLVITGRLTASNHKGINTIKEKLLTLFSGLIFLVFLTLSILAAESGKSIVDGIYVEAFYVYTFLAAIAFLLDLKVLRKGGVFGKQRIARHLWRMILALFIATGSLFLGQPQVFPEFIQASGMLAAPVILVVLALLFWLIRVFIGKRFSLQ